MILSSGPPIGEELEATSPPSGGETALRRACPAGARVASGPAVEVHRLLRLLRVTRFERDVGVMRRGADSQGRPVGLDREQRRGERAGI
jgi:hypothetical protein